VLHDGVQVHEQPSPEHAVGIGLSGCVTPHEPLERRRLVGRVVVDVHPRVASPPFQDRVDHFLERLVFFGIRVRPVSLIRRGAVSRDHDQAEQVFAPSVTSKGVPLEVEK
jgi:hypothetical protein